MLARAIHVASSAVKAKIKQEPKRSIITRASCQWFPLFPEHTTAPVLLNQLLDGCTTAQRTSSPVRYQCCGALIHAPWLLGQKRYPPLYPAFVNLMGALMYASKGMKMQCLRLGGPVCKKAAKFWVALPDSLYSAAVRTPCGLLCPPCFIPLSLRLK